jgi:hypothetical protein
MDYVRIMPPPDDRTTDSKAVFPFHGDEGDVVEEQHLPYHKRGIDVKQNLMSS